MLGRRPEVIRNAAAKLNAETGRSSAEGRVSDAFNIDAIDALWSDLQEEGIYVDVLALNAASFGATKPILEASREETWQDFEANVKSPLAMAIKFAKQTTGTNKKVMHFHNCSLPSFEANIQLLVSGQHFNYCGLHVVYNGTRASYLWLDQERRNPSPPADRKGHQSRRDAGRQLSSRWHFHRGGSSQWLQ
jgi:NAD(P)-dependent dehydrogenase (short-subunit alcohol dehydrogenase family)